MPACSTRSRASSVSFWRSISFSASCCSSTSRASRTASCFCLRRPKRPGIMSLRLMPTSSTPCGGEHLEALGRAAPRPRSRPCDPRAGPRAAARGTSRGCRSSSSCGAAVPASAPKPGAESAVPASTAPAGGAGGPRRARAASSRTVSRISARTMATADLHQVADHRLDVAPDVADLGELGGLDLEERRVRELGQAARDLGLADAGGADHQDVLGHDLLGQRRRRAAGAASGCAARSPPRAWPPSGRPRACRARRRSGAASGSPAPRARGASRRRGGDAGRGRGRRTARAPRR